MLQPIALWCSELRLGKPQAEGAMEVYPLYPSSTVGPDYQALGDALREGTLTITESSEHGSVPDLQATNRSDRPALLLNGEQLLGAKQDRILNTTVLVPPLSTILIPVNCTEQGRWHYTSRTFTDAEFVMPAGLRTKKEAYVAESLRHGGGFSGDQAAVWRDVEEVNAKAGAQYGTGALKDGFAARKQTTNDFCSTFRKRKGQCGLLVFIHKQFAGLEVFSREDAYRSLHSKLIRSYAMDTILTERPGRGYMGGDRPRSILKMVAGCRVEVYPSVGMGSDVRLKGEGLIGSALVYENVPVYTAFFPATPAVWQRASRRPGNLGSEEDEEGVL